MSKSHHHDHGIQFVSHTEIFNALGEAGYESVRDTSKKTKPTHKKAQKAYPDMKITGSGNGLAFNHANKAPIHVPLHLNDKSKNNHVTIDEATAIYKKIGIELNLD